MTCSVVHLLYQLQQVNVPMLEVISQPHMKFTTNTNLTISIVYLCFDTLTNACEHSLSGLARESSVTRWQGNTSSPVHR